MSSKKEKTLYPWAYERVYAEKLTAILKQTEKKICDFVSFDDQSAGFDKRFNAFLETLRPNYGQQFSHDLAAREIDEVNRFVTLQIQKTIDRHDKKLVRDALGDLSAEEKVFMNAKLAENVSLIKSIGDEYLNKVQDAVYRGWSGGMQTKDIIVQIQGAASEGGITSVSERRAKLIARDQVGSIAGQLTKFKSESAGINYFTWETAADERVRAAHRAIDGKIFSWSEGWGGVFPGEPIQCRCVATAVFDDEAAEAEDSDFWDPEADDAVLPGKKNGSPNPPKVEPVAVEKPDMPYYENLANKPDWLKASGAKMDLPTQQKGAEISTGKVEMLPMSNMTPIEVAKNDFYQSATKTQMKRATERLAQMRSIQEFSESEIVDIYKHIGEPKAKFLTWLKTKSQEFQNRFGFTSLFQGNVLTRQMDYTNMRQMVGDKNYQKFTAKLENIKDEDQRRLYEVAGSKITYSKFKEGRAFAQGSDVTLNQQSFDGLKGNKSPLSTVFHENGHALDSLAAMRETGGEGYATGKVIRKTSYGQSFSYEERVRHLSGNPEYQLKQIIGEDLHAYIFGEIPVLKAPRSNAKDFEAKYQAYVDNRKIRSEKYSEFIDNMVKLRKSGTNVAALSDMLEAQGYGAFPIGVGHGLKYWKWAGNAETEFFAEVSETLNTDPKQYKLIKSIMPNAVKKYHEIVKDAIKILTEER